MRSPAGKYDPPDGGHQLLFIVLACLFVMSITIPLAWHQQQRSAGRRTAGERYPDRRPGRASWSDPSDWLAQRGLPVRGTRTAVPPATTSPLAPPPPQPLAPALAQPASPYAHLFRLDSDPLPSDPLPSPQEDPALSSPAEESPSDLSRYQFDHPLDPPPRLSAPQAWPVAEVLKQQLEILENELDTHGWAAEVLRQLDRLVASPSLSAEAAGGALAELEGTVSEAQQLADQLSSEQTRALLNSARYDLQRRLHLWRAVHELAVTLPRESELEATSVITVAGGADKPGAATTTVNLASLLADVEQYEHTRRPSDGKPIADVIEILQSSANAAQRAIGDRLDQHYRNANFRAAVSGHLINRLMPQPGRECGCVNEHIMGMPVWGDSSTFTRIQVELVPDPHNVRLGVQAWGRVHAQTTTASGPVYVHSDGESDFVVHKLFLLDDEGLKAKQTASEARSCSELVGIDSDFDRVPLVRGLIRNRAEREHDEMHADALRITEAKVAAAARARFDGQVIPQLQRTIASFQQQVWEPLVKLGLEPTAIDRQTTDLRAVTRLRVGSQHQLTAHTARPRAPSDSWASMQIHESALNNGLQQLQLDGKTMTLEELYRYIAQRLDRPVQEIPDTMPANVNVSFAAQDAVRVRCEKGEATLTLSLAEVCKGKKCWRNLQVRGHYVPAVEGLHAGLVRKGPILLVGHQLRTRDQVALRGVFSKLLSKSHQLKLVPDDLADDTRLADMAITQTKIANGWIGVAMGPRPAEVAATADAAARPQ